MKTILKTTALLAVACLLTGCGGMYGSTRQKSSASYANYILGLHSQTNDVTRKVSTPINLAVAQAGEPSPAGEMLDKLRGNPALVSSVVGLPLPTETIPHYSNRDNKQPVEDFPAKVRSVCNVARSVGADYIFIYGGNLEAWQEQNGWMILDLTIIGGATVPSPKINCESRAAGALIRTDTAEAVLFVNADARRAGRSPSYLATGRTDALLTELRDEVAVTLTDELLQKLAQPK